MCSKFVDGFWKFVGRMFDSRTVAGRRNRRSHQSIELLEVRALLTTFNVTNLNDAGAGSLRDAIVQANGAAGADTITFLTAGTILLSSGQLTITDSITINGPGAGQLSISGNNTATRVLLIDNSNASLINVEINRLTIQDAGDGVFNVSGGGINNSENLTLNSVVMSSNDAGSEGHSGALSHQLGGLAINDCVFTDNHAGQAGGGAIKIFSGAVSIVDSTFSGNTSVFGGGAIVFSAGQLAMSGCTISGNIATTGGGLWLGDGTATIVNTTISGNLSRNDFGGVFVTVGSPVIRNATITGNRADSDGNGGGGHGGIGGDANRLTLHNSIVAGNLRGIGTTPDDVGVTLVNGSSFNLIGNAATAGGLINGTSGNIVGVNGAGVREINTILNTTLSNNGGPTQTHMLVTGSPAINAGSNAQALNVAGGPLVNDQRGNPIPRVFGATVDIGSLELLPAAFVVSTLLDELDSDFSSGDLSLREAIGLANANRGSAIDVISFAPSLTGTITLGSQLQITDRLTINGPGTNRLALSGGQSSHRVLLLDDLDPGVIEVSINDLTIRDGGNGTAGIDGAGVRSAESLTMRRVVIANNHAGSQGGGGVQVFAGTFVLQDSTVHGNRANQGGGLELFGTSHAIINSTISGNQANGHGGGLIALIGPTVVRSSTITGNRCDADGVSGGLNGGAAGNPDLLTLHNSIVAGNFQGTGTTPFDAAHLTVESSFNLIGFAGAEVGVSNGVNGNIVGVNGSGVRDINTILNTTLSYNGGPTQTHLLVLGSVAIDKGDPSLTVGTAGTNDQRGPGFIRILDSDHVGGAVIDIGTVESPGIRVTSPNPNAFTLRPTFTWTPIAGATSYNIQINNESTNVAPYHLATVNGTSYTPNVDLAIGKFKMWVRPNFGGTPGNWSAPHLFNNLTPTTWQTISRTQLTSRPTLSWNALAGAAKYDIWINNHSTGQQQVIRQDVTGTSFTPTADLPMGLYRCWIRGVDAKGNAATWSVLQELLVVPGPTPIGPLNATFDRTPTFSWNPVTGAASYEVFIRNRNTGGMVINGQAVAGTNFTPSSNLTDGPYRWWAVAVSPANIGSIRSGGSTTTDIYVGGQTTLIAPIGNTTDTTPTFTWRAVDGVASYQLTVNRIDVTQVGIINQTGLTGTSFTPATTLPKGTYRAWVRAVSTTGELSIWSVPVDFVIA